MKIFFRLGINLPNLMEQKFNLMYYTSMTSSDFDNMDIRKIDWLHSRLIKQKRDEDKKRNS